MPRTATHKEEACPFLLQCSFSPPAKESFSSLVLPKDMMEFWSTTSSARLFHDIEYGQWGLEIFSRSDAERATNSCLSTRPTEFYPTDLVIGRFLGDSDLLILRADPTSSDFGSVLVALPIDRRPDWYTVSPSFTNFIGQFYINQGAKYWE